MELKAHIFIFQMKPNDSLPEKICRKCYVLVKHAANFRKTCRNSDNYLQSILQRTKSASSLFRPERRNSLELIDESVINDETKHDSEDSQGETNERETIDTSLNLEEIEEHMPSRKRKTSHSQDKQTFKKLQIERHSGADNTIKNSDDLITQVDETEETLEEILDNTGHIENNKLNQQEQKDLTELLDLEVHIGYNKLSSTEIDDSDDAEAEETNDEQSFKHDSEELYYLLKGIKDESDSPTKNNQPDLITEISNESQVQDDNVEFLPEDEDASLHLESETDDSQAQVSSTVEMKEEFIEIQEQNSNISNETNELSTEYIVDEYLIVDSDSNTTTTRSSNFVVINKKLSNATSQSDKKRAPIIMPNRKARQNTASSSTTSNSKATVPQVWVCDICGNHFGNRQLMNAHMKVHRQEKNHECE